MTVGPLVAPKRRLRGKVRLDSELPAQLELPGALEGAAKGLPPATTSSSSAPGKRQFVIKKRHPEYLVVQGVFDADMLSRAAEFLAKKRPRAAKMKNEGGNSDDERKARYDDRDCRVSWFNAMNECPWLHERLTDVTAWADRLEWRLLKVNLDGSPKCEYEETQYAVYGPKQHF